MEIIAIFFAISVSCYIYYYSDNITISTIVLFAFYFSFTITGLRQTVALSFLLFSYRYIDERRIIKFGLMVSLAALFHSTAILFAPAYFIGKLRVGKKQLIFIGVSVLAVILFSNYIRQLISLIAWNEAMRNYASSEISLTWSGFLIHFAITIFCWYFYNRSKTQENANNQSIAEQYMKTFINCMVFGLVGYSFSTIVAESFRIGMYYSISEIVIIPAALSHIKLKRNQKVLTCIIMIALLLYCITGNRFDRLLSLNI